MTSQYLRRFDAASRRLYPPRSHARRHIFTLMRKQFELVAQQHLSAPGGGTLVDFGCADMPYRAIFESHVGRYAGIDLPGNALAEYHLLPDGTTSAPDCCADVVLSTQVLEHTDDPGLYLRECRRMLKSGGLLILSTHGIWRFHPDPHDWWRWTGAGLRRVIEEAGFQVREVIGLMGLGAVGLQLLQDAITAKVPRWIRPWIIAPMQAGVALADRLHRHEDRQRDACVYVVVAALPAAPAKPHAHVSGGGNAS